MGEAAPQSAQEEAPEEKEQGTHTDFDGSFDSFVKHTQIEISGVSAGMEGFSEAAELGNTIQGLGKVVQKFPEFRHWAERRLREIEDLGKVAKQGNDVSRQTEEWKKSVNDAFSNWEGTREEIMRYETIGKRVKAIGELRRTIQDATLRAEGNLIGIPLENARKEDLKELEKLEDIVVSGHSDREGHTLSRMKNLYEAYGKEVPLEFQGLTPGNLVRAQIKRDQDQRIK